MKNPNPSEPTTEGLSGDLQSTRETSPDITSPGANIGPYKIVRKIGQGGMGAVYLGVRSDGEFVKHVAIKVISGGTDSNEVLLRFRRERQILASLDHPNIAKLLDGGTTENGLPYFVMEYVSGQPLTEYCDGHKLTIDERLTLFRSICSAVQYAHRNLIIHRDLKPGNILVTADGTVKLLDFGIAKLLNVDAFSEELPLTATDMRVMTPEYASPEQAKGDPITTSSDVYSLGVILYELLSGQRPYRFTSRNAIEVLRVISEQEVGKPSTLFTKSQAGKDTVARLSTLRGGTTEKLHKQLRGDLDNIILMALRKEPQRRYGSVEALSEDIGRYLGGLPVLAQESTWKYRAGKYVRRHKAGVSVTAAVLSLVLVFSVIVTFQNIKIGQQRDVALKSEQRAMKVTDYLASLFEVNDPVQSKGKDLTAREILELGSGRLQEGFKDQPEVQAELMCRVGIIYAKLGMYDRAEGMLKQSLDIGVSLYRYKNIVVARAMHGLGNVLLEKGQFEESEKYLPWSLDIYRTIQGKESPDIADTLKDLARVLHANGKLSESERRNREALALDRKLLGDEHPSVATDLAALGSILKDKGAIKDAENLYRQALALNSKILGNEHPEVATDLKGLADVSYEKGSLQEAEEYYKKALLIDVKFFGNEHPVVASDQNSLAGILKNMGQLDSAETLARQALASHRKMLGNKHRSVAADLTTLAAVISIKGKLDEAEKLLREAKDIMLQGKLPRYYNSSLSAQERAAIIVQTFDSYGLYVDGIVLASVSTELASVLREKGQVEEAENWIRISLEIESKLNQNSRIAGDKRVLAGLLELKWELQDAERSCQEALEIDRKLPGTDQQGVLSDQLCLANLLVDQRKLEPAEKLYRETLSTGRELPEYEQSNLSSGIAGLSEVLLEQGKIPEAAAIAQELQASRKQDIYVDVRSTAVAKGVLGAALTAQQKYEPAEILLLEAYEVLSRTERGRVSPANQRALERLVDLYERWGNRVHGEQYGKLWTRYLKPVTEEEPQSVGGEKKQQIDPLRDLLDRSEQFSREISSPRITALVDNGDGTVTSQYTDSHGGVHRVMWAGQDNGKDINWSDANEYCRDSHLAGHDDWRLPTVAELLSLVRSAEHYVRTIEVDKCGRHREEYDLTELIGISCNSVWSADICCSVTKSDARYMNFLNGYHLGLPRSESVNMRVLPARSLP